MIPNEEVASYLHTGSCHVSGAGRFDFLDIFELILAENFIKVGYDLVQQAQTLDALVIGLEFHVKLRKVGNRGEHNAHTFALLVIQLLIFFFLQIFIKQTFTEVGISVITSVCLSMDMKCSAT